VALCIEPGLLCTYAQWKILSGEADAPCTLILYVCVCVCVGGGGSILHLDPQPFIRLSHPELPQFSSNARAKSLAASVAITRMTRAA
jgi:hypothetical protein